MTKLQCHRTVKFRQRGEAGLWYDYLGVWGEGINSVTNTARCGWWVKYVYNSTTGAYGFYMNILASGRANTTTPANSSGVANTGWERMGDDRKCFIGQAFFGEYAAFGAAVINGNWMISKNGTVDGVEYNNGALYDGEPAYMRFDELNPNGKVRSIGDLSQTAQSITLSGGYTYTITIKAFSRLQYGVWRWTLTKPDGTMQTGTISCAQASATATITLTDAAAGQYTLEAFESQTSSSQESVAWQASSCTGSLYQTGEFVPVFAIDMLTGMSYFNDLTVGGDIMAKCFYSKSLNIPVNISIDISGTNTTQVAQGVYEQMVHTYLLNGGSTVILPDAETHEGLELQFFALAGTNILRFPECPLYYPSTNSMQVINGNGVTMVSSYNDRASLALRTLVTIKAIGGAWYTLTGSVSLVSTS